MNLAAIEPRIQNAVESCGRNRSSVTLIAVSKEQPIERVFAAYDAGLREFGENTAQGLRDHRSAMEASGRHARWHFIGRLQRNKINMVLKYADVIASLDRVELVEALAARANSVDVLIQVNIGREEQKGGVMPEGVLEFAHQVAKYPILRLQGLMAIPPADVDPEPYFKQMADLSRALQQTAVGQHAKVLSLGMSSDFETAIRCGSTQIRVGESLFGARS